MHQLQNLGRRDDSSTEIMVKVRPGKEADIVRGAIYAKIDESEWVDT